MQLKFTKMQGLGNDFMVVDAINQTVQFTPEKVKQWAHRQFGVGFDQLLVVEKPSLPKVDFKYRIFNADGSEVQQCGNGARCFARFVVDKKLTTKTEITVETASGIIVLYIEGDLVRVNMGQPNFNPSALPFTVDERQPIYSVPIDDEWIELGAVSMGNPHAVLLVDDIEAAPVAYLGALLESHPWFPERVNVGFAQILNTQHIKLRVYERGAAETLACGTGACAAVAVLRSRGLLSETVTVSLPGGDLVIRWSGLSESPLWMTGPAVTVFEGVMEL
ncbi:diaminopimelate epimerase [Thiomicrorhabdus aquaedulcis]|uniref:diaminopimelate epimerase n=1 Tax=Thiomicrorhabdus aquaedulcis TaxID=2211106 RepID=UPI000FDB2A29|nr:diaminopimelate epimerase [Thiomicrorhabdus aquaedulcis]